VCLYATFLLLYETCLPMEGLTCLSLLVFRKIGCNFVFQKPPEVGFAFGNSKLFKNNFNCFFPKMERGQEV